MKTHHLLIAMLCGALPTLYSCSNEDLPKPTDSNGVTLTLSLGVAGNGAPISRSDHKQEVALAGEKAVNDVTLIIYDRPINSSADAGGKILKIMKTTTTGTKATGAEVLDPSYYITYYPYSDVLNTVPVGKVISDVLYDDVQFANVDIDDLEIGQRYYAMAFVNFGNTLVNASDLQAGKPLNNLRNYVYSGDLYATALETNSSTLHNMLGYNNFRMSAINEVSFLLQRNGGRVNLSSSSNPNSRFLVQRLAARLDVGFGVNGSDSPNSGSEDFYIAEDNNVYLYVYDYDDPDRDKSPKKLTYTEGGTTKYYRFCITDIQLINPRETSSGTYLVERSKAQTTGAPVIYLDNEGWDPEDATYASKVVQAAPSATYPASEYSLLAASGRTGMAMGSFIVSGALIWQSTPINASVIGYMTENIDADNYTRLRITGYTDANTSSIFQAKSRAMDAGLTKSVSAEIPISHSLPTKHHDLNPMLYGVVRNTIYRVQIRVFASKGEIYFRYYYYGNLNTGLPTSPYTATGFQGRVEEATGGSVVTPND